MELAGVSKNYSSASRLGGRNRSIISCMSYIYIYSFIDHRRINYCLDGHNVPRG